MDDVRIAGDGRYGDVAVACVVTNADGRPVAVAFDMVDAAAFARCLGYDAPAEHMAVLPIVEFKKRGAR